MDVRDGVCQEVADVTDIDLGRDGLRVEVPL